MVIKLHIGNSKIKFDSWQVIEAYFKLIVDRLLDIFWNLVKF